MAGTASARHVFNVLCVGVGGQGVVLAAEVIARAAIAAGCDTKKSEVHGLAMRGGAVQSHVRFGDMVHSPLVPDGQADVLVGFEELEALRFGSMVRSDGAAIVNLRRLNPAPVAAGRASYPEKAADRLRARTARVVPVPAEDLARRAGNPRSENFVILGVVSRLLPLPPAAWQAALTECLPRKAGDVNLRAFAIGLSFHAPAEQIAFWPMASQTRER